MEYIKLQSIIQWQFLTNIDQVYNSDQRSKTSVQSWTKYWPKPCQKLFVIRNTPQSGLWFSLWQLRLQNPIWIVYPPLALSTIVPHWMVAWSKFHHLFHNTTVFSNYTSWNWRHQKTISNTWLQLWHSKQHVKSCKAVRY